MKKQEFIAELSDKLNEVGEISQWHSGYKKGLYDALILTRKLEEPEKTAIPQYVADYIERFRRTDEVDLFFCVSAIESRVNRGKSPEPDEIDYWIIDNQETFTRAWLNGYEVEKEKRYRLRVESDLINPDYAFLNYRNSDGSFFINSKYNTKSTQTIFTESELENIDETGFEREEVEETE